jgi:hypothetical protein
LRGSFRCTSAGLLAFNLPTGYRPAGERRTPGHRLLRRRQRTGSHTTLVQVIGSGFSPGSHGGVLADATAAVLDGSSFRAGS